MPRRLWTVNEAREYLEELGAKIGRAQFYHLVKSGRIPSVEIGRLYVVDIDDWVDALKAEKVDDEKPVEVRRGPAPVASRDEIEKVRRPRFGGA